MRLDTTPTAPAPSISELGDWIFSQPLGLAVLLLLVIALLREWLVTGAALKRERDRADKLQSVVDKQSAGLTKATDVARESLETVRLVHALMQGIDTTLRQRGERGR